MSASQRFEAMTPAKGEFGIAVHPRRGARAQTGCLRLSGTMVYWYRRYCDRELPSVGSRFMRKHCRNCDVIS